LTPNSG